MKRITILIFASIALAGCSSVNERLNERRSPHYGIPKELIDGVITEKLSAQPIKDRDADDQSLTWDFKNDKWRCFAPSGDPDNITASTADIYMNIGAYDDHGSFASYYHEKNVLFGKIVMHYKMENLIWKLESIDSEDLRRDTIKDELKGEFDRVFSEKIEPLCGFYNFTPRSTK